VRVIGKESDTRREIAGGGQIPPGPNDGETARSLARIGVESGIDVKHRRNQRFNPQAARDEHVVAHAGFLRLDHPGGDRSSVLRPPGRSDRESGGRAGAGVPGHDHGRNMDPIFSPLEVIAIVMAIYLTRILTYDVESSWLEGLMLIGVYILLGNGFAISPQYRAAGSFGSIAGRVAKR